MRQRPRNGLFVLLISLLATACGGSSGGGGGGGPAPAAPASPTSIPSQMAAPGFTLPAAGTVPDTWFVSDNPSTGELHSHSANEEAFVQEVLSQVNAYRMANGLNPVAHDPLLEISAKIHAEDMARRAYFSHSTQDFTVNGQSVSGFSAFDRMSQIGATYSSASENIAGGQSSPSSVMNAWKNSSGHNSNLLNPNHTHLGVGYAAGGPYGHYWVQNFRRGGNAP